MRRSPRLLAIALTLSLLLPLSLAAQGPQSRSPHTFSLTISAPPALDGIVQIHGEFAGASGRMSLAGLIGGGSVAGYQAHFIGYDQGPFPLFLAGMQWNYYLLGDFEEGMQIGAQTLIKFTSRDAAHYIYYRNGTGLEIVPYLGYKVIVGPGITFNAQAGAGTIINKEFITTDYADTPDGSVERRGYYDYTSFLQPLLHLNFGWSF